MIQIKNKTIDNRWYEAIGSRGVISQEKNLEFEILKVCSDTMLCLQMRAMEFEKEERENNAILLDYIVRTS